MLGELKPKGPRGPLPGLPGHSVMHEPLWAACAPAPPVSPDLTSEIYAVVVSFIERSLIREYEHSSSLLVRRDGVLSLRRQIRHLKEEISSGVSTRPKSSNIVTTLPR